MLAALTLFALAAPTRRCQADVAFTNGRIWIRGRGDAAGRGVRGGARKGGWSYVGSNDDVPGCRRARSTVVVDLKGKPRRARGSTTATSHMARRRAATGAGGVEGRCGRGGVRANGWRRSTPSCRGTGGCSAGTGTTTGRSAGCCRPRKCSTGTPRTGRCFCAATTGTWPLANSAALKLANITAATKDPAGRGDLPARGREDAVRVCSRTHAMDLVEAAHPGPRRRRDRRGRPGRRSKEAAEVRGDQPPGHGGEQPRPTRRKLLRIAPAARPPAGELTCRMDVRWPIAAA